MKLKITKENMTKNTNKIELVIAVFEIYEAEGASVTRINSKAENI